MEKGILISLSEEVLEGLRVKAFEARLSRKAYIEMLCSKDTGIKKKNDEKGKKDSVSSSNSVPPEQETETETEIKPSVVKEIIKKDNNKDNDALVAEVVGDVKVEDGVKKPVVDLFAKPEYVFSGKGNRICSYADRLGVEHKVEITDDMIARGQTKGVNSNSFRVYSDVRTFQCVMEYLRLYGNKE